MISGRAGVGLIIGTKPAFDRLVHGHLQQRHFQPGADAAQEVET